MNTTIALADPLVLARVRRELAHDAATVRIFLGRLRAQHGDPDLWPWCEEQIAKTHAALHGLNAARFAEEAPALRRALDVAAELMPCAGSA